MMAGSLDLGKLQGVKVELSNFFSFFVLLNIAG